MCQLYFWQRYVIALFVILAALNCFIFSCGCQGFIDILGYFEPVGPQKFRSSNEGRDKIPWKYSAKETASLNHLGLCLTIHKTR